MLKNRLGLWGLLATFAVLFVYAVITLPFEVPDENAHYSSVNFLYNEGRMPTIKDKQNLSYEEQETEKLLGVMEHENKYSYHPEYRIEQIDGYIGKYESLMASFNTPENRKTYTIHQAALYPPLYYYLVLPFYTVVAKANIVTRLFVTRLPSVAITMLTVAAAYFFGLSVSGKNSFAATLAFMVLYFPMTGYIGGGINSDNLHNLIYTLALTQAVLLIMHGWEVKKSIGIGCLIGLDLMTKPQGYILIPTFLLAVVLRGHIGEWRTWFRHALYILVPILIFAGWQEIPKFILGSDAVGATAYTARVVAYGGWNNFRSFMAMSIHTTVSEMIVWYWGVFKWFGVLMPRIWWWTANRLVGLAVIGFLVSIYRDWKARRLSMINRIAIFSIGANAIYMAALFWFDWQFYQEYGRSLGLQPRYYMPLLVTQMFLLLHGILSLGWNAKVRQVIRYVVIFFFLGLQLASVWTQLTSYYDFSSWHIFLEQLSQYKPIYAKGGWWYLWLGAYILGIITTTYLTFISDKNDPAKTN
jgi:4-amino-4-deoxy-L-arabinose transferase-like glycosyltransferase